MPPILAAGPAPNTLAFERNPLIDPSGFREYDARWWYGKEGDNKPPQINLLGIQALGLGLGTLARELGAEPKIITGHDYRAYSMSIKNALNLGLIQAGMEVIDIGLALSPTAYFAQVHLEVDCVAMVTASHNDNGWTGVKMGVEPAMTFGPTEMSRLKTIVLDGLARAAPNGSMRQIDGIDEHYIAALAKPLTLTDPFRVVVACGNGTAGAFAPEALRRMGVEVIEIDCDLDHSFPRYNPNPEDTAMLAAMAEAVRENGADLGLGFDGDGDRCGVVDNEGEAVFADKIGLMLARDLASRHDGAIFVVDVKSTGLYETDPVLAAHNARVDYYKTGHSYIKRRTREIGALAGFEKSGHFFFAPPLGHGYDDALTAARAILQMLARNPARSLADLKRELGTSFTSPTMSPFCADDEKYDVVTEITAAYQDMARSGQKILGRSITGVNTINGARVRLEDGSWVLVRASSNKPEIVVVVESMKSEADMRNLFHREVKPRLAAYSQVGAYNQEV